MVIYSEFNWPIFIVCAVIILIIIGFMFYYIYFRDFARPAVIIGAIAIGLVIRVGLYANLNFGKIEDLSVNVVQVEQLLETESVNILVVREDVDLQDVPKDWQSNYLEWFGYVLVEDLGTYSSENELKLAVLFLGNKSTVVAVTQETLDVYLSLNN